ncbi:MAG: DUF378 domain-containing protein [Clostridia bacterium]|nr:DUF378 domain-containing protein [Clostridia bacterium]
MKALNSIILALVIIGAINWGCIGLFKIDLIGTLFGGAGSAISRILFTIVGIAGIWAFTFFSRVDRVAE